MRKIFLDLGVHNGNTLELAIKKFPHLDMYVGVEPVLPMFNMANQRLKKYSNKNIQIFNIAVDDIDVQKKKVVFYEDCSKGNHKLGSSLLPDKTMRQNKKIEVECWDICYFFDKLFKDEDKIILKVDIEGKEYDIFKALIQSGKLKKYVTKIFCEWHWNKVPSITKEKHNKILIALNHLGYNLKGKSELDQFYCGF